MCRRVSELRLLETCTYPSFAVVTLVDVSDNTPNATDSGVLGGWWFGASPSSPDSNFLRVHNAFPNRRLSDNALMMPPKIRIAPSCASSPGGTPGGGGLPIRRHSSIGPQERRGSTVNLSPPTVSERIVAVFTLSWIHKLWRKYDSCNSRHCYWQDVDAAKYSNGGPGKGQAKQILIIVLVDPREI